MTSWRKLDEGRDGTATVFRQQRDESATSKATLHQSRVDVLSAAAILDVTPIFCLRFDGKSEEEREVWFFVSP